MQLSELCGIITPPTNPFNPIITQQLIKENEGKSKLEQTD